MLIKYYTVYKITNLINGKIYVGQHSTVDPNDNYMGSSKVLAKEIQLLGIHNFKKEILFIFDTFEEACKKEAEIVDKDFINRNDTYNIIPGGTNGYYYINKMGLNNTNNNFLPGLMTHFDKLKSDKSYVTYFKNQVKQGVSKYKEVHGKYQFEGKKHSEDTKKKISQHNKISSLGENNSQYGTMWITNGSISKKIKQTELIPDGWHKGRKIKLNKSL